MNFYTSWLMQTEIKHTLLFAARHSEKHQCSHLLHEYFYVPFTFINTYGYIFFTLACLPAIRRSAGASVLARCLWLLHTVTVMDIFRDTAPSRGRGVKGCSGLEIDSLSQEHRPIKLITLATLTFLNVCLITFSLCERFMNTIYYNFSSRIIAKIKI